MSKNTDKLSDLKAHTLPERSIIGVEDVERQVPANDGRGDAIAKLERRYAAYLLILSVVLIAAVLGGLCGSGKCSGSSETAAVASESPADSMEAPTPLVPTEAPTATAAAARTSAIATFINVITLTNKTIAYPPANGTDSATAEERALQWLIEEDPLQLTASDQFRLQQRYALLTLWYQTSVDSGWIDSTGWLTVEEECNWFGVTCVQVGAGVGELRTVVDRIELAATGLRGRIPADLGLLQNHLTYIDLSSNSLKGSLPASIGLWTALQTFNTVGNSITGTLPSSIGQWTALTYFDIRDNSFNGTLPDSIGNWSNLGYFSVINNTFTGTIPESVGNWSSVYEAHFNGNDFTGSVPNGICDSANLNGELYVDCLEVSCTCCPGCA